MTPGVQSRDDTAVGAGHDERDLECIPAVQLSSAFDRWIGIELLFLVTGEAEAGSAGEQPAEE
jgi:hypothetical protein